MHRGSKMDCEFDRASGNGDGTGRRAGIHTYLMLQLLLKTEGVLRRILSPRLDRQLNWLLNVCASVWGS